MLAGAALLVLAAGCSRGGDNGDREQQGAASPEPTRFAATPAAAGISGPPQTPAPLTKAEAQQQSEGVLRRVAIQSADLPPSLTARPPAFRDAAEVAGAEADPTAALQRLQTWGLVLAYDSGFSAAAGAPAASTGQVTNVSQMTFAFASPDGPRQQMQWLEKQIGSPPAGQTWRRVDGLQGGEETIAWRQPAGDVERWTAAVRRGTLSYLLTAEGTGSQPETLLRDLVRRLDQRLAAAAP